MKAHADARRRMERFNVGRVLALNNPPASSPTLMSRLVRTSASSNEGPLNCARHVA